MSMGRPTTRGIGHARQAAHPADRRRRWRPATLPSSSAPTSTARSGSRRIAVASSAINPAPAWSRCTGMRRRDRRRSPRTAQSVSASSVRWRVPPMISKQRLACSPAPMMPMGLAIASPCRHRAASACRSSASCSSTPIRCCRPRRRSGTRLIGSTKGSDRRARPSHAPVPCCLIWRKRRACTRSWSSRSVRPSLRPRSIAVSRPRSPSCQPTTKVLPLGGFAQRS